jgi:hypothetical protein
MKRKWAERKEKERGTKLEAERRAKDAVKADYERRKKERQLTEEEKRREKKNGQRRRSRARWNKFCSDLYSNLLLRKVGASMRKEAAPWKPTLESIIKIAGRDFGFKVTAKRTTRLARILDSL